MGGQCMCQRIVGGIGWLVALMGVTMIEQRTGALVSLCGDLLDIGS